MYNGISTWNQATSLSQLIDYDPEDAIIAPMQLQMRYFLVDENRIQLDPQQMETSPTALFLRIEQCTSLGDLHQAVDDLCAFLYGNYQQYKITDDQAQILRRTFAVWLQTVILSSRKFAQTTAQNSPTQGNTNNNTNNEAAPHNPIKKAIAELLEVKDMLSQRLDIVIQEKIDREVQQRVEQQVQQQLEQTKHKLMREIIRELCELFAIDLTEERQQYIESSNQEQLEALKQAIKAQRNWPDFAV